MSMESLLAYILVEDFTYQCVGWKEGLPIPMSRTGKGFSRTSGRELAEEMHI